MQIDKFSVEVNNNFPSKAPQLLKYGQSKCWNIPECGLNSCRGKEHFFKKILLRIFGDQLMS